MQDFFKVRAWDHAYLLMERISKGWAPLTSRRIRALLHPQWGIGAAYLVILEPPLHAQTDFWVRIYDGRGELCFDEGAVFVAAYGIHRLNYAVNPNRPLRLEVDGDPRIWIMERCSGYNFRWTPLELIPEKALTEAWSLVWKETQLRCFPFEFQRGAAVKKAYWMVSSHPLPGVRVNELLSKAEQPLGLKQGMLLLPNPSSSGLKGSNKPGSAAMSLASPSLSWSAIIHSIPPLMKSLGIQALNLEGRCGALHWSAPPQGPVRWTLGLQPLFHGKVRA